MQSCRADIQTPASYNHSKDNENFTMRQIHRVLLFNHGNDNGNFQQSARAVRAPLGPLLSAETSKCCVAVLNTGANSLWVQLTWYNTHMHPIQFNISYY